eukprot:COSAG01_NODE_74261_length_220_cov_2840.090909_1_plen_54_part_10
MYSFSMKCKGRILDVCSMAKAYLTPAQAHRLWRHINVAHALGYIGLQVHEDSPY